MKRLLLIVLRCVLLIYLAAVIGCAGFQRKLMYFPSPPLAGDEKMARIAAPLGLEPWRDPQGRRIGWRQVPPPGVPPGHRMVVFHGNAGSSFDRDSYAQGFGRLDQGRTWQVYLFEYPGYGGRPGVPTEEALCAAARAAVGQLEAEDARPIYFTGESLGSGVACALAAEMPGQVSGIFLMTPFAAFADVASHHYSWLPVKLILQDRWENAAALRQYHGPLAVMVAGQDEVVTTAQSEKLYQGYAGPKKRWFDADATHNSVSNAPTLSWWREVSDFLLTPSRPPG